MSTKVHRRQSEIRPTPNGCRDLRVAGAVEFRDPEGREHGTRALSHAALTSGNELSLFNRPKKTPPRGGVH